MPPPPPSSPRPRRAFSVRLPEDVARFFEQQARIEHRSLNATIVHLLEREYTRLHQRPRQKEIRHPA